MDKKTIISLNLLIVNLPIHLIKGLFTFNANKRWTTEQALKNEPFKDIKDLVEARFPLFVKLQDYDLKNKEFRDEIIFTKKKTYVKKVAKIIL
jgi:allophanate hydrolase subunit 1